MDNKRIPVTIITGFLGAGKTTLLNQLIQDHPEKKFAIIENEFGEIGIDGALIVGADENIFELAAGCICCSLNDGFNETIENLMSSQYSFDHLLVETTGIADPDSIIQAFLSSNDVQLNFRLDSVICLADCSNMEDLIDEQPEVRKQLALADLVLLNKADTVQAEYLTELKSILKRINPIASIHTAKFGKVDNVNLLDLKAFSGKSIEKATMSYKNMKFVTGPVISQKRMLSKEMNRHAEHDIVSHGFAIPGSLDTSKFSFWIHNFLLLNMNTVFRVKGVVSFSDKPEKYIIQAVRDSFMFEAGKEWADETRFSKLVFIGKNLVYEQLEDTLFQLLASPAES
jgi:G3E family GTPase